MKIIISHDVDHLYITEHLKDTFLPGSLIRTFKSLTKSSIGIKQAFQRYSFKVNRVQELHEFNKSHGVKETFFFGMRNGLNLSYNYQKAFPLIKYLVNENVLVGLHGQGYNNIDLLKEEKDRILQALPAGYPLGIRNHYLRQDANTLNIMSQLGFRFDSTDYFIEQPRMIGKMWEIPISVMDAGFISHFKNDADELKTRTAEKINEALEKDLPFFVVNFHDIFFNEGYPDFLSWYKWLIPYLAERFEFINFSDAVTELNAHTVHQ